MGSTALGGTASGKVIRQILTKEKKKVEEKEEDRVRILICKKIKKIKNTQLPLVG